MYPSTFSAALVWPLTRRLAQSLLLLCPLFCRLCWLALWLLPVPLVRAQTGVVPQAAAQAQAEAQARELERQFSFLFSNSFSPQRSEPAVPRLELGKPLERELAGGQSHAYSVTLSAGQYLHVVVEQRGIDVVVTLFGPAGQKLLEVDSPNGDQGPESLRWIVVTAGLHRLEVRALEQAAKPGRYEVKLVELRAATSRDRDLAAAKKLDNESESLSQKGHYTKPFHWQSGHSCCARRRWAQSILM